MASEGRAAYASSPAVTSTAPPPVWSGAPDSDEPDTSPVDGLPIRGTLVWVSLGLESRIADEGSHQLEADLRRANSRIAQAMASSASYYLRVDIDDTSDESPEDEPTPISGSEAGPELTFVDLPHPFAHTTLGWRITGRGIDRGNPGSSCT